MLPQLYYTDEWEVVPKVLLHTNIDLYIHMNQVGAQLQVKGCGTLILQQVYRTGGCAVVTYYLRP